MTSLPPVSSTESRKPRRKAKAPPAEVVPVQHVNGADPDVLIMPPEFTDDAIALRFSAEFSRALKYVDDWSRWMLWDGRVWKRDNTLRVYDLIRRTIRAIGPESADDRVRANWPPRPPWPR